MGGRTKSIPTPPAPASVLYMFGMFGKLATQRIKGTLFEINRSCYTNMICVLLQAK